LPEMVAERKLFLGLFHGQPNGSAPD
jgi:hypothetical protein